MNTTSIPSPNCRGRKSADKQEALAAIRDAIELPLLHADLFAASSIPRQKAFFSTVRPDAERH